MKPKITIIFCNQCNWMLRAAWMAQEILSTFGTDLEEVSLSPCGGGIYEIWLDDQLLFSRKEENRFPEAKEIKQKIRDVIAPERSLGHSDSK